jgi:YVTN family beta-propeller protein
MTRLLVLAALVVTVSATVPAFSALAGAGMLYIANEGSSTVSAIEIETGHVKEHKLPIAPHNIDVTPDGRRVLAVGTPDHAHGPGGEAGQLVVLDATGDDLRVAFAIAIGGHPAHVVPSLDGRLAYVTDGETDSVLVVDLDARSVAETFAVGSYPHGLRLSPDGATLAIANMRSGTVSLINTDTRETTTIEVGRAPVQVGFSPDGKTLWVSLNGENSVAKIDLSTGRVSGKYPVGNGPVQVYATPDGSTVLIANQGNARNPDRTVSVLDAGSGGSLGTVVVGDGAHGITINSDGSRAFVTNTYDDTVSEIDIANLQELRRFVSGTAPNGVAIR